VWALIDTSVYIDYWRAGLYADALDKVRRAFIVRHSSVVLSELRRGARTDEAQRTLARLHAIARVIWTPTAEDWWEAGRLVRSIGDAQDWGIHKRRDFQNDALLALTARRSGATVVTANGSDFDLLRQQLRIRVLAVGPDPRR
jgi:predicted nucleic acid-binding protein